MNPRQELAEYLGDAYDPSLLTGNDALVMDEFRRYHSAEEFYKRNTIYLYHLTVFGQSDWKQPFYQFVREVSQPCRMLDYGCGIGADGLALAESGYIPAFADYESKCTDYLKWRLKRRELVTTVYDIEKDNIPRFPLVVSFDVIEHAEEQWSFLCRLAELGRVVVVNLTKRPPLRGLHFPVDAAGLEARIGSEYQILSAKTYNEIVRVVAFRTPERRRSRKKTKGVTQ
jgi:SAM-dependent methyltransferase